jgi:hypothetical protein
MSGEEQQIATPELIARLKAEIKAELMREIQGTAEAAPSQVKVASQPVKEKKLPFTVGAPDTDPVMYYAKNHVGIDALTRPYHYRGQIFGPGDQVESVKRAIQRWERILEEDRRTKA